MGLIYKIINQCTNKVYVGQTTQTLEQRFATHIKMAIRKTNRRLYDSMNHYGYENFKPEVIEECVDELLNEREIYWIKYYDSTDPNKGYNMTEGGGGGNTWKLNTHKEETLAKLSAAHKGQKRSVQAIANMCRAQQMRTYYPRWTEEQKARIKGKRLNIFYKDMNIEEAIQKITTSNTPLNEIATQYNLTWTTFIERIKRITGKTPRQLRGYRSDKGNVRGKVNIKNYAQYCKEHKDRALRGKDSPVYKSINREELIECLKKNIPAKDIARLFNISIPTLIKRTRELFNMTIREVKNNVKQK